MASYTSRFKNKILWLVLLIAGLSLTLVVTEIVLRRYMSNENRSYFLRYHSFLTSDRPFDVLMLGDSRAVHGVIPSYFTGHSCYNFSFNGASPCFYDDILDLITIRRPKLVIYAVNNIMFDTNQFFRKSSFDRKYFGDTPFIMSERGLLRALVASFKGKIGSDNQDIIVSRFDNGFVPYSTAFVRPTAKKASAMSRLGLVDQQQVTKFKHVLETLNRNNIRIIFVCIPEYLPDRVDNKNTRETYELIYKLAKQYSIPFLDYNNKFKSYINVNGYYYSDVVHLNERGAKVFSQKLSVDMAPYL